MKSWIGRGAAALCIFTPFAVHGAERASRRRRDRRGNHRHRAEARHLAAGRAVLDRRADRRRHQGIRRDQHRRARAQRPRPLHRRSRPRPEPGRDPRHQRRPGHPRPARREGIGRHLSRRIADLRRAVHAGPRPLRPRPHRSAARPAGHAVRRGLVLGHRALHHRAAGHRRVRRLGGLRRRKAPPMARSAARCAARSTFRSARRPRCAWSAIAASCRASSTPCYPGRATQRRRERRHRARAAASRSASSPARTSSITPRIVYQKLETDGYPRVDFYNILGNTLHDHASRRWIRASAGRSRSCDEGLTTSS